jgi:tRNA dimethylallyltransferase
MVLPQIIFIVGPTAVGKSEIAFLLAKDLGGEIVSCDAMQVYKGISIVSNKPPREMLAEIPHHLIGVISVAEDFNVASFRRKALTAIRRIHRKKKIPIVVGGSGMYVQILLDGIFTQGTKNLRLQKRLEKEAAQNGLEKLYQKLVQVDPAAANKIHPHDKRRIIRALEVFLTERKPISQLQRQRQGLWGKYDICLVALSKDRDVLYQDIDRRVNAMLQQGLVEEVRALSKKKLNRNVQRVIGIPEIQGYLRGEYSLDQAKELLQRNTRRFAKRQLTWFRKEKRLNWLLLSKKDTPLSVTRKVKQLLCKNSSERKKKKSC